MLSYTVPKLLRFSVGVFFFMNFIFMGHMTAQDSSGKLEREGDAYFEAGNYRAALQMYKQAGLENTSNKKLLLRIGISKYEINDVEGAVRIFHTLINQGKTEALVFFYLAKSLQSRGLFPEAIANYKKFLQRTDANDPLRVWVKDELTRCANGSRLKYADQIAYVENAGTAINTQYDEFGVKNSPTTIDKIYFNSNRVEANNSAGGDINIYTTSLDNGRWTTPAALPVNSSAYDEVTGFSSDGQILYYLTNVKGNYKILTDTFSDNGNIYSGEFRGPFNLNGEGADVYFFNDSICMFAADLPGGYGGFDLYISTLANASWSKPVNLGPAINTFHNERYPFLTRDGETLFFSADHLGSMGGYDIFRAVFDSKKLSWSLPENIGFPINSNLDETHFVLSPDGMTAFITSDRKDSYGGKDLYRVFFKQPVNAHQQISVVPTFYQSIVLAGADKVSPEIQIRPLEVKEYFISHLFLEENGEVLAPQNVKKLDLLANLLLIYPQIKAELSSFEVPSGQKTFSLYFSIKKSEAAADYLKRKGVPANRLLLKGYGSSFPLALNTGNSIQTPVYLKLNHRIEIGLHNFENEPVITHLENIPVPENLQDPKGAKFSALRHKLYYSVQIASVSQILQNLSLESIEEVFIDLDNAQGNYRYMAGMLPTYKEAEGKLNEMIGLGFTDAFIVAYLDGVRLTRAEIPGLVEEYPDLLFFLTKDKN